MSSRRRRTQNRRGTTPESRESVRDESDVGAPPDRYAARFQHGRCRERNRSIWYTDADLDPKRLREVFVGSALIDRERVDGVFCHDVLFTSKWAPDGSDDRRCHTQSGRFRRLQRDRSAEWTSKTAETGEFNYRGHLNASVGFPIVAMADAPARSGRGIAASQPADETPLDEESSIDGDEQTVAVRITRVSGQLVRPAAPPVGPGGIHQPRTSEDCCSVRGT